MNIKIATFSFVAVLIFLPLTASATDLITGGGSLSASALVGDNFTNTAPSSRLATDIGLFAGFDPAFSPYQQASINPNSVFGVFQLNHPSDTASHCQTGGTTGKRILTGAYGFDADGYCRDYSAVPVGFSGPNGQAAPDLVNSAAPLNQTNLDDFLSGPRAIRDGLMQVPTLSILIALPINLGNDIFGMPISAPDLSQAQICEIFSGTATSWDQVNSNWPNQAINVVYRSDGSGASFAFTQYLASTCNVSQTIFVTSEGFNANSGPISLYANAIAVSGDKNVVETIANTAWSIGYAGLPNVLEENLDYATINGVDPATSSHPPYGLGNLLTGEIIGAVNPITGLPQTQAVTGIDPNCVLMIDPAAQLTGAYPIAAVTNLLAYTDNNTDLQALEDLVDTVINGSGILPTGVASLAAVGATTSATATSCIN
jgi:phosphate transport system substrate-binding protein